MIKLNLGAPRSFPENRTAISGMVEEYLNRSIKRDICLKKSLLLDFPQLRSKLQNDLISQYIDRKEAICNLIKKRPLDAWLVLRELYNYSSDALWAFKEGALRDNLIIFYFNILREAGSNNKLGLDARKYFKEALKDLFKLLEPDLRGRKPALVDMVKLSEDYRQEKKWLKENLKEMRSDGNIRLYLKKRYLKLIKSKWMGNKQFEEIVSEINSHSFRNAALIVAQLKQNRNPSKRGKDYLAEINKKQRIEKELLKYFNKLKTKE